MIKNTLPKWLKGQSLSATQLARDTGIHPDTIRKLIHDPDRKPTVETIEKIVDRYGCSPMDLIKVTK